MVTRLADGSFRLVFLAPARARVSLRTKSAWPASSAFHERPVGAEDGLVDRFPGRVGGARTG